MIHFVIDDGLDGHELDVGFALAAENCVWGMWIHTNPSLIGLTHFMVIWPKLTVVVDATSRARTAAGLTATELLRFAPKKKTTEGLKNRRGW